MCRRPFSDVENMRTLLIVNHNEVVAPEDTVFFLGDVSFKGLDMIKEMNGKKILVAGNHDLCYRKRSAAVQMRRNYIKNGFAAVIDKADFYLDDWGLSLTICHFPFQGNSHYKSEDPYWDVRPVDDGQWCVHGHVHDLWKQKGRQINVGVDAWAMYPVSFDTILDLIEAGENDLESGGRDPRVDMILGIR